MTRMKSSGFDWRCPCGWQTGRVRTAAEVDEMSSEHRQQHERRNARLARRWDGKHYSTCPYECDCPQDQRRPA